MPIKLLINPSEPRIWALRFENEEAELFSAYTFQEAILAWWNGIDENGNATLFDVPIEISSCLNSIGVWLKLPATNKDGTDWFELTIVDITEEYNGIQSGEWIAAELPPIIKSAAEREAEKQRNEQNRLLRQYKKLQAMLESQAGKE